MQRCIPRASLALGLALVAAVASFVIVPGVSSASPGDAAPQCESHDLTVPSSVIEGQVVPLPGARLLAGGGDFTIHGSLCLPSGGTPKTVMLALHGITYSNSYWNSEYQPETYNFSRHMTDAGYAVFAIDRLGYGQSSKPPAALVTLDSQAEVAHQVISQLRSGTVGGTAFEHVILVGHSYGTATSWRETATYNDADAVIGTGWANTLQTLLVARFFAGFVPAQLDKRFADRPVGYLTPGPGGREQNYLYDLSNVDPKMIKYDAEVLQDTVTAAEGATFYNRYGAVPVTYVPTTSEELEIPLSAQAKDIKIPTFMINGANELFFCGIDQNHCASSQKLQTEEAKYFSDAACFRAAVIPNAGHDLNLQRNAPDTYAVVVTYANQMLGPDGGNKGSYRASCGAISGTDVDSGQATFGAIEE
ncbi:alpha/beta hydrolase [Pseudonocardia sp. GCM10023141]|uniref:alpha/beta hydrolase n=1 Tax=Pseudonocardia sp. GCM10023141 TaxID=3252653 RepID=UPI0036231AF8